MRSSYDTGASACLSHPRETTLNRAIFPRRVSAMTIQSLDEATAALAPFGYEPALLDRFIARAGASSTSNAVAGTLTPLPASAIATLPPLGSAERARLNALGFELIRAGRVGAVVLAGGMATRFGGVVKAVVDAHPDATGRPLSFLECKHRDVHGVAAAANARIPLLVMTSFATHETILAHAAARGIELDAFPQFSSLRLTPQGELFRDAAGALSPYATGHGDFTFALRASGALQRFREAGGTTLLLSNVDNLAATLDPAIIGLHAELGGAVTAEQVRKAPGDKGGAPVALDGVPQVVEGFRFPPGFDQDSIPIFNTNSLTFDAAAIDRDFALPYYRVEKQVDGRPAVQFERLVGELTAFLPARFVEVPRSGADGRFLPAKDPEELARNQGELDLVLGSRRWMPVA